LTTPVSFDNRDITGPEDMFWLASLAERQYGRVHQPPKLIGGFRISGISEITHGLPSRRVILQPHSEAMANIEDGHRLEHHMNPTMGFEFREHRF